MPYKEGGRWRAVVKHQGKRYTSLHQTKREAVAWETAKRKELSAPTKTDTDFLILCNRYLDHIEARYSKHTYEIKKTVIRRFINGTNASILQEITPSVVEAYLLEQQEKRSPGAANIDRKNLLAMFNWGIKILDIETNPVARIDRFPTKRKTQYTPPEIDVLKVLAVATNEDLMLLKFLVNTGARRIEAFRLRWDDVNFEKGFVTLWTKKTRDKSYSGRDIPMNTTLRDSLKWVWDNRKFKESPFVFVCDVPGKGYGRPYTTRRRWIPGLCQKAGVKPFAFHALRRYVASILNDKHKVSSKTIQRILGHSNVRTTEIYLQNIHNDLEDVMSKLG